MNRGQWYDFVVHYKYSYNGDGLIEVYGAPAGNQLQLLQRLLDQTVSMTRVVNFVSVYMEENDSHCLHYDAVRVGTSFE